jgi:LPXTG-motif cell wall-anchored protein
LAATGTAIGGILVLGTGMLAAGIAMLAVRRRRDLPGLLIDN